MSEATKNLLFAFYPLTVILEKNLRISISHKLMSQECYTNKKPKRQKKSYIIEPWKSRRFEDTTIDEYKNNSMKTKWDV